MNPTAEEGSRQAIDLDVIPETLEQIKALAAHADENICPADPEFKRVVFILNLASKRLEELGL